MQISYTTSYIYTHMYEYIYTETKQVSNELRKLYKHGQIRDR